MESLGVIGSEVKVARGFARNYLLPQKKAMLSTPANRNILERSRVKFELQIAREKAFAGEMAKRLEGVSVTITARVSDEDRLYGSVTIRDIIEALAAKGIEMEKRMVLLTEPIKNLGTYSVPIRVYKGIEPEITVEVVPEAVPE